SEERSAILRKVADALVSKTPQIMTANARDLAAAKANNVGGALLKRLSLTTDKIKVLCDGIRSLADEQEPVSQCKSRLELSEGLILKQVRMDL
ncbi:unnamed protein product, partial [Choristocarpus tenellus]